ncbi:hypothetical protein BH11PLA2_BH11PLA2_49550 [soil metagenome]
MRQSFYSWFSGPLVTLGVMIAVTCLGSTWYINKLQTDHARAVRFEADGIEAAAELQVQLRHLRFHSLVLVADPTEARRVMVEADLKHVDQSLEALHKLALNEDDARLVDEIERDYSKYKDDLRLDRLPSAASPKSEVAKWSDEHHMADLMVPCRKLVDRQRSRMDAGLERAESESAWAGRVLLGLGVAGVLAGLFSGYVTARRQTRHVSQLSVRVQAVQAHLNRNISEMIVEPAGNLGDLDEQLERVVGRVRDVCQKLQEQERSLLRAEQLAAVGQLAAGVAHEVRNPLTGVKLLLQAAARPQSATPLTPERLTLLLQEVARIERIVQGLVDFARTPPLNRQQYNLGQVTAEAIEIIRERATLKTLTLNLDSESVSVAVDHDQMLSLLTNLLTNAIDATPAGGTVSTRIARMDGNRVSLTVSDTGPGIDPAIADRLFTPFATTKVTGTGLGLALARRIAVDHDGTLIAANSPDGGAVFTLTLPVLESLHV